jgi:hypothetical protein
MSEVPLYAYRRRQTPPRQGRDAFSCSSLLPSNLMLRGMTFVSWWRRSKHMYRNLCREATQWATKGIFGPNRATFPLPYP